VFYSDTDSVQYWMSYDFRFGFLGKQEAKVKHPAVAAAGCLI